MEKTGAHGNGMFLHSYFDCLSHGNLGREGNLRH